MADNIDLRHTDERLETFERRLENGFRAVDADFQQVLEIMAADTRAILEAIKELRDG